MELLFAIKEEYRATVVGFNGSGLPLGSRTDLDKLAEMAYINPALAKYFEQLPTREELEAYKVGKIMAITEGREQEQVTVAETGADKVSETGTETAVGSDTPPEIPPTPTDDTEGSKAERNERKRNGESKRLR